MVQHSRKPDAPCLCANTRSGWQRSGKEGQQHREAAHSTWALFLSVLPLSVDKGFSSGITHRKDLEPCPRSLPLLKTTRMSCAGLPLIAKSGPPTSTGGPLLDGPAKTRKQKDSCLYTYIAFVIIVYHCFGVIHIAPPAKAISHKKLRSNWTIVVSWTAISGPAFLCY